MTRKEKINKFMKEKGLFIAGSFLVIAGLFTVGAKYFNKEKTEVVENDHLESFYQLQEDIRNDTVAIDEETDPNDEYIAVIEIPSIDLKKGLYPMGSPHNNLNESIMILPESNYPDVENGNFILAGHSGNASISYFRYLDRLNYGDRVFIDYNGLEYEYKVVHSYDIEKTGTADIVRNAEVNTLTLITCRDGTNNQIVFICERV